MQLTDLHFGESPEGDERTIDEVKELIRKETPDFVAVTGDIVSGFMWDQSKGRPNFWKENFAKLYTILEANEIPFGFVPGYHDFEADLDQDGMMDIANEHDWCVAKYNSYQHNGRSVTHQFTYSVPIRSSYDQNQVMTRLWFFGTGRDNCMGTGGMDCIRRDQVEWFKDESQRIPTNDKFRQNGIAFMHHALQEHMTLVNNYPVHGQKRDYSGCQALNTGLFSEFKQMGTVQWVTAGADHSTDFWGTYNEINLSYGRKTGYSSYGPKFMMRGARIFELEINTSTGDMNVDTWIRQQDGSIDE